MATSILKSRPVQRIIPTVRTIEGGGFIVRRPFPTKSMQQFDPFLLLDHLGPIHYKPGEAKGAPDHPHRGFETISYILEGSMQHKDSQGHEGNIEAGDVQWMSAGAGVVHSEMPSKEVMKNGGVVHGFQIWVNLPKSHKMMKPRYQEKKSSELPVVINKDGVKVKIVAGESYGAKAVIDTIIPVTFLHFEMPANASIQQAIPEEHNALAYLISGSAQFGASESAQVGIEGQMIAFKNEGNMIEAKTGPNETASFLVLAGKPIKEPMVRYGPFVMNTEEEIHQAFADFQSGRMGKISF